MNTQANVHRLEAGQALPALRRGTAHAVLSQGELLVQAPAQWLGGTLVQPAPVRITAPAVLHLTAGSSVIAVREASVVIQQEAKNAAAMSGTASRSAATGWGRIVRRWASVIGRRAEERFAR